jgi:hypothetical protein
MKKLIIACIAFTILTTSCRTLTSNTVIKPNESFVLGNNEHRSFSVKLKNVSANDLTVYLAPIEGGTHSPQVVKPNQSASIKVSKNTALIVNNTSNETSSVNLKVVGDTGLSMGYKSGK